MVLRLFFVCITIASSLLCMNAEKSAEKIDRQQVISILSKAVADGNMEEYFGYVEQFEKRLRTLFYDFPLDDEERTALHLLIMKDPKNIPWIEKLVNEGADILVRTKKGWTPVHTAAGLWNARGIELLLKHLSAEKRKEIVELKTSVPEKARPLHVAATCDNFEALEYLTGLGANINAEMHLHMTPVCMAAAHNLPESIAFLYKHGANIVAPIYNAHEKMSLLELAKDRGSMRAELCLEMLYELKNKDGSPF